MSNAATTGLPFGSNRNVTCAIQAVAIEPPRLSASKRPDTASIAPASGSVALVFHRSRIIQARGVKALVYSAWDTLEVRDVPGPRPDAGDVVLRVAAVGICGSELEAVASRSPRRTPPVILGHEFCGEVEELGPGVHDVKVGDRVAASSVIPCGQCGSCRAGATHLCPQRQIFGMNRPGAFAERVAAPAFVL